MIDGVARVVAGTASAQAQEALTKVELQALFGLCYDDFYEIHLSKIMNMLSSLQVGNMQQ